MDYYSTKIIDLGSCAFRQWKAIHSHCKYIHGYRLQAKFWFGCKELDDRNWVVDFGGLKELKEILEKQFDHTLVVAEDDPLLEDFKLLAAKGGCELRIMPDGVGIEKTAEWCFKHADAFIRSKTSDRCWVEMVEVWEHDKNSAIYQKQKEKTTEKQTQAKVNAEQYEFKLDPLPTTNTPVPPANNNDLSRPAPVGNQVTSGWSNPFGGTTWGS